MSTPTNTADPDGGPKGVLTADEQYALRTRNMFNLLKYLWTGALVGADAAAYRVRTGISLDHYNKYKTQLDPLIKGHCTTFKDVTYKDIVGIADAVYDYADQASGGGDLSASYYKVIFDTIHNIAACTDAAQRAQLKTDLGTGLDSMIAKITELKGQADAVTTKLTQFETDSKNDQAALGTSVTAVNSALTGVGGAIETLQNQIKKDQQDLEDDQDELAHDKLMMETSAAYAWCGPIGAIAAAVGVYGVDKANMEAAISSLNDTLKTERQELQDDKAILAELGNVKLDLKYMVDLIGPAIAAIESMMGEWDAVAHDLDAIKKLVDTDIRRAVALFSNTAINSCINKWLTLRNVVDNYRQNAYVSDMPKVTTLDEYLKDVAAAKAAQPK
ncbi:hypothetical protein DFH06DRAFT_1317658 [Mycena polygramma]|nr:hypothetical protein DFH06DRAFT_1317658 [Mycena polygramma]